LTDVYKGPSGEALLTTLLTSYPELGRRWYPDLLTKALKQQHEAKQLDNATFHREEKAA
jgi:hypothetical protein